MKRFRMKYSRNVKSEQNLIKLINFVSILKNRFEPDFVGEKLKIDNWFQQNHTFSICSVILLCLN